MFQKNRLYPLVLILVIFIVWKVRESKKSEWITLEGQTMGTTYRVKYEAFKGHDLANQIDTLLQQFNESLSTYIPNSEISRFNNDSSFNFELPYFLPVLEKSREINQTTGGAFDPTVMPLVNAWGFGPNNQSIPDSSQVDSLKQFVGFHNIHFDQEKVWKSRSGVMLDFSAIAKGYGVDVIGDYLRDEGIENYLVEIGGEVVAAGVNDKGTFWRLGIEDPTKSLSERAIKAIIELDNRGMATSGNYRNYYIKDGIRYAHTIDPMSGFPVEHSLLSATVLAPDCITADAYATAFMVLGLEKTRQIIANDSKLEVFLIYSGQDGALITYQSKGMERITIIE